MPPPAAPPPRKSAASRRATTRVRVKQEPGSDDIDSKAIAAEGYEERWELRRESGGEE
jgi:hypothetical protein